MPVRQVELTEELDRFIEQRVEAGLNPDANAVMCEALQALEMQDLDYEEQVAALRAAIAEAERSGIFEGDQLVAVSAQPGKPADTR